MQNCNNNVIQLLCWSGYGWYAARSYTFSPDSPFSLRSSFTQFAHLFSRLPLIFSFLILSNLVTPHIHRNIFFSATSIFFSCAFFAAHVSAPYTIAGLTIVFYTFPLILTFILLSHRHFLLVHPPALNYNMVKPHITTITTYRWLKRKPS